MFRVQLAWRLADLRWGLGRGSSRRQPRILGWLRQGCHRATEKRRIVRTVLIVKFPVLSIGPQRGRPRCQPRHLVERPRVVAVLVARRRLPIPRGRRGPRRMTDHGRKIRSLGPVRLGIGRPLGTVDCPRRWPRCEVNRVSQVRSPAVDVVLASAPPLPSSPSASAMPLTSPRRST